MLMIYSYILKDWVLVVFGKIKIETFVIIIFKYICRNVRELTLRELMQNSSKLKN